MSLPDIRIETERLLLRLPQVEDFERYAELMADAEACRHIGGYQPRAGAWRRFLQMPGAWALQGFAMFSVIERCSGRWLGQAGPWQPDGWPGTEIGYALHRDAWGRGYALEATAAAADWTFEALRWDAMIHCIAPDNTASTRLAQRLGSTRLREGHLPPPHDAVVFDIWGQSRAQWQRNRRHLPMPLLTA